MADAKKCDVCGEYYDKYYTSEKDRDKANTIILTNGMILSRGHVDAKELCPDCMKSVKEHLEYLSSKTTVTYGDGEKYHVHPAITCQDNGVD